MITMLIIAICIGLLCVKMFFGHKTFVSTHVDSSPALRKKGIYCARTQDIEMRTVNEHRINEHRN
ncbi:MAG: hypothetical protein RR280_02765 [Bacteroidaceae bacterium]